jgi:hypothetical protein
MANGKEWVVNNACRLSEVGSGIVRKYSPLHRFDVIMRKSGIVRKNGNSIESLEKYHQFSLFRFTSMTENYCPPYKGHILPIFPSGPD